MRDYVRSIGDGSLGTDPAWLEELVRGEPVLAVCGPSGAGKTKLLEQAIRHLCGRGLRVGVVKHGHHRPDLDPPGKDSAGLFSAGADVAFQGPRESFSRHHETAAGDLGPALLSLLAGHDLVLVEGQKGTPLPKLWVAGEDEPVPPPDVDAVAGVLPRDDSRLARLLEYLDRWLALAWGRRRVLGGLLVGGDSRRMGQPKQTLRFRGATLSEVAQAALAPHVEQVVVIGSGEVPAALATSPRLPDVADFHGPLAGMLAAMRWAPRAAWVFAACDLPLACPGAVGWLVSQRCPGRWAILPRVSERWVEPLLALYEPQAGPLLEAVVACGRLEPRLIAHDPAVVSPTPPPHLVDSWRNVNTPEEFAAIGGAECAPGEDW